MKMKCKIGLLIAIITAAFLLPAFTDNAQAKAQIISTQRPTTAKDSLVNADSLYINYAITANDVAGLHVTATRSTGTAAGKVYLQGSLDGTNYRTIDSVTLTNAAYVIATFPTPDPLPYARYRAQFCSSGTVKLTAIRGHVLRRSR